MASALVALVPLVGLSFARVFERELLRAEEEGMHVVAVSLAASLGAVENLDTPSIRAAANAAARRLGAQAWVLDGEARAVIDTGPERVRLLTRGRMLLASATREVAVTSYGSAVEPAALRARPEVARALAGHPAVTYRTSPTVRGVRLYVAEPIVGPDGARRGVVYLARSTYPVLVSLYRVRNALVKLTLVSMLVSVLVSVFLGYTISRPLRRLREGAQRIAAGERGVALRPQGHDEITDVARAFDQMARELDARLSYISDLAANVSHEFKTPLASIRGAAELLADGAADDPAARTRFLDNIVSDTERMSRLVSRLLELSRIESAAEPRVPIAVDAFCEALVARYAAQGVSLVWAAPRTSPALLAAPAQLETALRNLIDNALRASPSFGSVSLTVAHRDRGFRFHVDDRGAGVSEANRARLFERFFTTERGAGGTGLGLSIVKAIAESHGGTVSLDPRRGPGSRFTLSLPEHPEDT